MHRRETLSLQLVGLLFIYKFMKVQKKVLYFFHILYILVISALRWKIFLFVLFHMTAKIDYKICVYSTIVSVVIYTRLIWLYRVNQL